METLTPSNRETYPCDEYLMGILLIDAHLGY